MFVNSCKASMSEAAVHGLQARGQRRKDVVSAVRPSSPRGVDVGQNNDAIVAPRTGT